MDSGQEEPDSAPTFSQFVNQEESKVKVVCSGAGSRPKAKCLFGKQEVDCLCEGEEGDATYTCFAPPPLVRAG